MSDSSLPHGLQPTRLLCPWDSPGKSTGVRCHCPLRWSSLAHRKCVSLGNVIYSFPYMPHYFFSKSKLTFKCFSPWLCALNKSGPLTYIVGEVITININSYRTSSIYNLLSCAVLFPYFWFVFSTVFEVGHDTFVFLNSFDLSTDLGFPRLKLNILKYIFSLTFCLYSAKFTLLNLSIKT